MTIRYRLEITKENEIRYISHLDYARAMERTLRRANLPVAYSEGFNPHMKMAFASALAVGVTSDAEYVDIELSRTVETGEFRRLLSVQLPAGIALKRVQPISSKQAALMAVVNLAVYEVAVPLLPAAEKVDIAECINAFNRNPQVIYVKETPKGKRTIDIKQFLAEDVQATADDGTLYIFLTIRITPAGSVKPNEVIEVLTTIFGLPADRDGILIHRRGLYIAGSGSKLTPMDLL